MSDHFHSLCSTLTLTMQWSPARRVYGLTTSRSTVQSSTYSVGGMASWHSHQSMCETRTDSSKGSIEATKSSTTARMLKLGILGGC